MVKRIGGWVCALLLAAALLLPQAVLADAPEIRIEQVQTVLPDVQAYFHLAGAQESLLLSATLGGKPLRQTELRRYDPALDATGYFFLVDCSTSTTAAQMEAVKTALTAFAGDMDANATMTLITFGVGVEVVLERETDAAAIEAAVQALAPSQPGTVFFDALAKAIDLAGNREFAIERKLAFVFSDSVDYNLGGYTKEEIDKLLAATGLPFYALGFDTGTKQQLDNFGAVARASGGTIAIVSAQGLPAALAQMLEETQNALVARFDAGTNMIDAPTQAFALTVENAGKPATMQVPVRAWQPDSTPPAVAQISQRSAESICLVFSEPVQGATTPASFVVKNENGDLLGIQAAAYAEGEQTVTLTLAAPPPSGTFTVECPGVTDISMEQNKVADGVTLLFEGTPPEEPVAPAPGVSVGAWVFMGLVVLLIGAVIIAAAVRKRSAATVQQAAQQGEASAGSPRPISVEQRAAGGPEMQVHFVSATAPLPTIKLQVTSAAGQGRVVQVPINKTLFVGRSDICDVYFDDKTMSRQHFVIGAGDGGYTITNLSETAGTLLNGVPVAKPRPLQNGDTIAAGQQSMVFFVNEESGRAH